MCEQCNLLAGERVVGGDETLAIIVPKLAAPAAIVIPRQHAPLNELSQHTQQRLLQTANMLSSTIFESMQVHGTNIILRDEEHAYALVLGRSEEDGIDLRWKPNKATTQELDSTAARISAETWYIGKKEEKKASAGKPEPAAVTGHAPEKKIETRNDPHVTGVSARTRVGYEDENPEVDTPDEIARDMQLKQSKKIKKDNYLIRHLTRKR